MGGGEPPPRDGLGLTDDLIMALRFFSRLPTGDSPHRKPDLGRIAMALPLASVVIGAIPVTVLAGGTVVGLPAIVTAVLAVGSLVVCCGAMAEDALADAADGLFGGHTVERRLDIMKDSRHGTYGVSALSLFLLLRVAALSALLPDKLLAAMAIWLTAGVLSRSGALWLAVALPPARATGASAAAGQVSKASFAVGAVFALVLSFLLAGPATSLLAVGTALLVLVLIIAVWTFLCRRLVGGQTGDLIGALVALLEVTVLVALLPFA